MVSVILPLKTVNELNRHEHWRGRQRRAKAQRAAVQLSLNPKRKPSLPCRVHLTRIAPSSGLDKHDGLPASMKFIVDGVAAWLGVDDSDERIQFSYEQRRGGSREYAVSIVVINAEQAA